MAEAVANELSRLVSLADAGDTERSIVIEVTADEREALARRFGLESLDRMTALVAIRWLNEEAVKLRIVFAADVVQRCVVTLEPLEARVEGEEEMLLVRPGANAKEIAIDPTVDEPEPLLGDTFDIGEAVAEQFGLALNPYPRKSGVEYRAETTRRSEGDDRDSPFETLRRLTAGGKGAPRG